MRARESHWSKMKGRLRCRIRESISVMSVGSNFCSRQDRHSSERPVTDHLLRLGANSVSSLNPLHVGHGCFAIACLRTPLRLWSAAGHPEIWDMARAVRDTLVVCFLFTHFCCFSFDGLLCHTLYSDRKGRRSFLACWCSCRRWRVCLRRRYYTCAKHLCYLVLATPPPLLVLALPLSYKSLAYKWWKCS